MLPVQVPRQTVQQTTLKQAEDVCLGLDKLSQKSVYLVSNFQWDKLLRWVLQAYIHLLNCKEH